MNSKPETEAAQPQTLPLKPEDLHRVGFPEGVRMAPGLAILFNDALYSRCRSIAVAMAEADSVMPRHLKGKAASCFAIISRAITWNLDPFAVAQSTYETPGGRIGFEGKLVQAIMENSGRLEGGIVYEMKGEWEKLKGKYEMKTGKNDVKYPSPTWTRADAAGLSVIVSAQIKGETERRTFELFLDECFPLNSPLWATRPRDQIKYAAVRAFANIAAPSLLMGVPFDVDIQDTTMTDITPRADRPDRRSPFERGEAAERLPQAASAEPQPEAEKAGATGGHGGPLDTEGAVATQSAPPTAEEPEPLKDSPSERRAQEFNDWIADQYKQMEKCENMRQLNELHNEIHPNLEGDALAKWEQAYGDKAHKLLEKTRSQPKGKR